MRMALMVAGGGLALAMGASAVEAAPLTVAPVTSPTMALTPAVATGSEAKLILVRGGCGWGAHRTWVGRCHLNYGWRGRVRARTWRWRHWR